MPNITFAQFESGIITYIENEIIKKITDWRKWLIGGAVALGMGKFEGMYAQIKENPIIKSLGVIDDQGLIDIDSLYNAAKQTAQATGSVTQTLPILGATTFTVDDIDSLYRYILEAV